MGGSNSIAGLDEEARFVSKALNDFCDALEAELTLKERIDRYKVLRDVNRHYKAHRDTYKKQIFVKNADIFKLIAWAAMFLYADKEREEILLIACLYMNEQLKKCKRELPQSLIEEMVEMLCYDKSDKDNLAIGKNGFYMSFRLARDVDVL